MKDIMECERRYNMRVRSVLEIDQKLGLIHSCSEVSMMCKEMLACMLEYFPKIYYVEIQESSMPTGVSFSKHCSQICSKEEMNRYLLYPEGWHSININSTEMYSFKEKIKRLVDNDLLYRETILEPYKNKRKKLEKVLYQYGLMHVFYHEYGHAVDGHVLAEEDGKIECNSLVSKALEYNADLFAVNQMCKRFLFENRNEICVGSRKIDLQPILEEFPLMVLGVYIFQDSFYDRKSINYHEEIQKETRHLAPFLRQYYITSQFAGIWVRYLRLSDEDLKMFNQEVFYYLDAFEKVEHGGNLLDAPFFLGQKTIGMLELSKAQKCWNSLCEKLLPYISPGVELMKTDILNVATKKYEKNDSII